MPAPPTSPRSTPLSCVFALNKPSGESSMTVLKKLQPLFASSSLFTKPPVVLHPNDKGSFTRKKQLERVRIGQSDEGGSLDPEAEGVLVIGTHDGTKALADFGRCTKEYRVSCAFESSDNYIEGATGLIGLDRISGAAIEAALDRFRGEISQVLPVSERKKKGEIPSEDPGDREATPDSEPQPDGGGNIRTVTVHELSLVSFTPIGPSQHPHFELTMTVSSATNIRILMHDLSLSLQRLIRIISLTRTRQGPFMLRHLANSATSPSDVVMGGRDTASNSRYNHTNTKRPASGIAEYNIRTTKRIRLNGSEVQDVVMEIEPVDSASEEEEVTGEERREAIEWEVFREGIEELKRGKKGEGLRMGRDDAGWLPWESELLRRCRFV